MGNMFGFVLGTEFGDDISELAISDIALDMCADVADVRALVELSVELEGCYE